MSYQQPNNFLQRTSDFSHVIGINVPDWKSHPTVNSEKESIPLL